MLHAKYQTNWHCDSGEEVVKNVFTIYGHGGHLDLVGCFGFNGPLRQYLSLYRAVSQREGEWLVGCVGFNGPLRQYFSLYRAVSQREGERGEKG